NEDAAVPADQLQAYAAGIDETAVEDANNRVLERQRSREDDVDAARPGDLLSPGAHRLAAEQPKRVDAVRPDVHERTALERRIEARVGESALDGQVESERRADQTQLADCARGDQLQHSTGLR